MERTTGTDGAAVTSPHPPLDAELLETVWPTVVQYGIGFNLTADGIPALRAAVASQTPSDEMLRRGGTIEFQEHPVPGFEGSKDLSALVLRPAGRTGPLPCIVYTANGGKIMRGSRGVTQVELDWVVDLGLVMVVVSPPVGPEDPHPALIDGAYSGLVWTAEHAEELGIDPDRLLVYGKSGGGGLAAATALLARDRGGPALAGQVLMYPMLDDREITSSSRFEGIVWDRTSNKTGWTAMLGEACGGPDVSPYAAPARAEDLSGLPPTYIEVGSAEVFRDEDIDYAVRLLQAGVPTELHVWVGGFHGYDSAAPAAEISVATVAARNSYLRRALRVPNTTGTPE